MPYKKISLAILGSTGSIGITTLKLVKKYSSHFNVDLLACNKNKKIIASQIKEFLPKYVIIKDKKNLNFFKKIKFKKKIKFFQNLKDFNKEKNIKFDKVILGISSISGLDYAFSFIKYSKEILLANKETIVCGGKFFLQQAKKNFCNVKSIDSEHYCIAEALKYIKRDQIHSIYLTASGGPFLNKSFNYYSKIDSSYAILHPKWKMGKKISIDSATMVNKSLEIMEASILFNFKPEVFKIKIHKESKVHSAIVLKNGLVNLLAHNTSMEIPIVNSLLDQKFISLEKNFFSNKDIFSFSFDEQSLKKFNIIPYAYKMINYGQRGCIFFNVINDYLVYKYLENNIYFFEIINKLIKVISNKKLIKFYKKKVTNIKDIYDTISYAKKISKTI